MATDTVCPLLQKLSPELRNLIYVLVLTEEQDVEITVNKQLGLAETCRQIRQECLAMYFSRNTFRALVVGGDCDALNHVKRWLSHIGPRNCRHLQKMYIDLTLDEAIKLTVVPSKPDTWILLLDHIKEAGCSRALICEVGFEDLDNAEHYLQYEYDFTVRVMLYENSKEFKYKIAFDILTNEHLAPALAEFDPMALHEIAARSQLAVSWAAEQYKLISEAFRSDRVRRFVQEAEQRIAASEEFDTDDLGSDSSEEDEPEGSEAEETDDDGDETDLDSDGVEDAGESRDGDETEVLHEVSKADEHIADGLSKQVPIAGLDGRPTELVEARKIH